MNIRVEHYKFLFICISLWSINCLGFSDTYFYELYLHNEYYAEPPGFPTKTIIVPIASWFTNKGDNIHEKRSSFGIVGATRLTHNHAWIEFIAAIGKERVKYNHSGITGKQSRVGSDDFLIDFGYNFLFNGGTFQILAHWLTGIPIERKVTLAELVEPLYGTRLFATGPVVELVYEFRRNEAYDIFIGFITRILRRFDRHYEPILPSNTILKAGYQIDLLALFHYRHYGHNFEVGYVPTFFTNLAQKSPLTIERLPSLMFNSVYLDYFYYNENLSMGFEANVTKTFGKTADGVTICGSITWYF